MIRISITAAAFHAIADTMVLGSVAFEAAPDASGKVHIWLPESVVNKLRALRGSGESYSDVILRLAEGEQR